MLDPENPDAAYAAEEARLMALREQQGRPVHNVPAAPQGPLQTRGDLVAGQPPGGIPQPADQPVMNPDVLAAMGHEVPEVPPEQAPPTGKVPPHRAAAATHERMNERNVAVRHREQQVVAGRPRGSTEDLEGVQMPVETLGDENRGQGQGNVRGQKVTVNQRNTSSRNPRFTGGGG